MTGVSLTGRLCHAWPETWGCASIRFFWNSVVQSTDSAFRRVHVIKKDAEGNIKFYDKKETFFDKTTGQKRVVTRKDAVITYIEDVGTGALYLDETTDIIAMKCVLTALGMPFYALGKMCWHAIKTFSKICWIASEMFPQIGHQLVLGDLFEAAKESMRGFVQVSQVCGTGLLEIVKSPLFALGCELAAIYGIFRPYQGRVFEAWIEKQWEKGASYKDDLRNVSYSGEDPWTSFKKCIQDAHPVFFDYCFQSRGSVNDSRIVVLYRDSLSSCTPIEV
jgi:hypothetical protein